MLELMTPPATTPVSLEDVKDHLRIDGDHEDAKLTSFIEAATLRLDGADGFLGRALITQTWRLYLKAWPQHTIGVPLPPCQAVEEVGYVDPGGVEQTMVGSTDFFVVGPSEGTQVVRAGEWPTTRDLPYSAWMTFRAGYGEPADVPAPIREAILSTVGAMYEHREAVVTGTIVNELAALNVPISYRARWFS